MNHSFNIEYAQKYGIEEAILIENFIFWISKNKANRKHDREIEIDGAIVVRTFTYNSATALAELFPYMTVNTLRRVTQRLCDLKVLAKGVFNTNSYDRTTWFCFVDENAFLYNAKSILQNCEMEVDKKQNGIEESPKSYTDINTNVTTHVNKDTKNNPISTSTLLEIKSKLKKINENLKIPYIESDRANIMYDTAAKGYDGNFDELFQDTLKKLLDLSTKQLEKWSPIRKGISIQSLTAFNCELIGAIAIEHAKVFPKSKKVEVIKEILPEKDQHEKEIVEFVKYFSGKVPSFPIDKLGKHLQSDKRVQEIYMSLKEASWINSKGGDYHEYR